ncbi:hypothetical protein [Obesumbacterium proteus]|uniref:hypothetical protein n=1 Tax=Obesumbacterium proteus TaxID=82983 RepID=UPI0024303D98|nr:hypothetical protein [Obesumbacterium proteus]
MSIKGLIRLGSISLIMVIYSVILFGLVLGYYTTLKYVGIEPHEQVTAVRCNAVIDDLTMSFDSLTSAAFFGYFISIAVILLIFKKVR